MDITQKLRHEIVTVVAVTTYFCCWLGVFLLIKYLLLAESNRFYRLHGGACWCVDTGQGCTGAGICATGWLGTGQTRLGGRSATNLFVCFRRVRVLLIEHAFEIRHESGGFTSALSGMFRHIEIHHVLLNTLCLTLALLSYNMLSVVRKRHGKDFLLQIFLTPLAEGSGDK